MSNFRMSPRVEKQLCNFKFWVFPLWSLQSSWFIGHFQCFWYKIRVFITQFCCALFVTVPMAEVKEQKDREDKRKEKNTTVLSLKRKFPVIQSFCFLLFPHCHCCHKRFAGSYGSSVFSCFWGAFCVVLHSGCPHLSYQQCMRVSFPPKSSTTFFCCLCSWW
jgi:hypothetical protein